MQENHGRLVISTYIIQKILLYIITIPHCNQANATLCLDIGGLLGQLHHQCGSCVVLHTNRNDLRIVQDTQSSLKLVSRKLHQGISSVV